MVQGTEGSLLPWGRHPHPHPPHPSQALGWLLAFGRSGLGWKSEKQSVGGCGGPQLEPSHGEQSLSSQPWAQAESCRHSQPACCSMSLHSGQRHTRRHSTVAQCLPSSPALPEQKSTHTGGQSWRGGRGPGLCPGTSLHWEVEAGDQAGVQGQPLLQSFPDQLRVH